MRKLNRYPFYKQPDELDCAPTCLRMISKYYRRNYSLQYLREVTDVGIEGASLKSLGEACEAIGIRSLPVKVKFEKIAKAPLPCICYLQDYHFVVVYEIGKKKVTVGDPEKQSLSKISHEDFREKWENGSTQHGAALILEKTPLFDQREYSDTNKIDLTTVLSYLKRFKGQLVQIFLGMLVGLLFQTVLPFLTQSIVDIGIANQDINFIKIILAAQMIFFAGRILADFIRNWVVLYLGTKINLSMVSDFILKLLKLPHTFFDRKTENDLMERISDNRRVEDLLTNSLLNTLFSTLTLLVFSSILAYYSPLIFFIFLSGSVLFVTWHLLFQKRKKELDNLMFSQNIVTRNHILQIFRGIGDIKVFNVQREKRWEWESIQAVNFKLRIKWLKVTQLQQIGTLFVNEGKNIIEVGI